jgi:hypothetical protein
MISVPGQAFKIWKVIISKLPWQKILNFMSVYLPGVGHKPVSAGGLECQRGYPQDCPAHLIGRTDMFNRPLCDEYFTEQRKCGTAVNIMFDVVLRAAGRSAYEERQRQHCDCCPKK